jgi:hypothetical protein
VKDGMFYHLPMQDTPIVPDHLLVDDDEGLSRVFENLGLAIGVNILLVSRQNLFLLVSIVKGSLFLWRKEFRPFSHFHPSIHPFVLSHFNVSRLRHSLFLSRFNYFSKCQKKQRQLRETTS